MANGSNGGWEEYRRLILSEIERCNREIETLKEKESNLRIELTKLQVKAGIIGAIAGFLPGLIVAIVKALT